MRWNFPLLVPAVGLASLLALSGCSSGTDIALLDREQLAEDRMPEHVDNVEDLDPDSVRLAVVHKQVQYFIARSTDPHLVCVYAVPQDGPDRFLGTCGRFGSDVTVARASFTPGYGGVRSFALVPDGTEPTDLEEPGWEQIHPNILISDRMMG